MNVTPSNLIHNIAQNFHLCLADFPADLKMEHLDVPDGEQYILFAGLPILRAVIGDIYDYFTRLTSPDNRWSKREYCYRAIEGAVKLLWALGAAGKLVPGSNGFELQESREKHDETLKRCGVKDPKEAFVVLEAVGFNISYHGVDGLACPGGYKKCVTLAVRYPSNNDPLLIALVYYALHLPEKKNTKGEKGFIFEIFLRADFRPLLPGYTFHIPHLPAVEEEVTRTFDPATLAVWRELTGFMTSRHPQYRLYFRVPRIRGRGWVADYSTKENDYGLWSMFVDEGGLSVRIVFNASTLPNLLKHIPELSPQFQETYLDSVKCKDCVRCGKHVFYNHNDHVHRLCKTPWYISPYLGLEDLPDIKRLLDFRLAN